MRKKFWKRSAAVVLMLVVLSTGLVANAEGSYTVKEGDYLKKIARSVYGDPARWEDIYAANRDSVKNPGLLYKGQVLILPDIDPAPAEEQDDIIQTTDQEETATENAIMTLEQWTMSEECSIIEELTNEIFRESGVVVEIKADGNKLVFVYHLAAEVWGEITAEEMADMGGSDLKDLTEGMPELPEMVEGMAGQFDAAYGIKLDGIRYVFVAPDGIPFDSIDIKNE